MSAVCPAGHQSESTDYCDTCGMPIAGPGADGGAAEAGASGAGSAAGIGSAPTGTSGSPGTTPGGGSGSSTSTGPQVCPSCSTDNPADALFCEACGYDFTTGTMPRPPEAEAAPHSGGSLDLGSPDAGSPGAGSPGAGSPVASASVAGSPGATSPDPGAGSTPEPSASTAQPLAGTVPVEWVVEVWVDPDWYAVQSSDDPCPSPGLPVVHPLRTTSLLVGRPSASRHIVPDIDCSADTGVSRRQAQLTTDGRRWWVEDLQSSNGTWVAPASGPLPTDPVPPGQRRELAEDDRVYIGAWTRLVVRRATPEEQDDYA